MFSIGDIVCYPMHGIGTIEAIEDRDVLGVSSNYYIIRFVNNRMTAMIPVNTSERVGLRSIISTEECEKVIEYYLSAAPESGSDNWNQRYRDNLDKLREGDLYSIVDVILCLNVRHGGRGLSSGERKMLSTARSILITELAVVSGRETADVEAMLT